MTRPNALRWGRAILALVFSVALACGGMACRSSSDARQASATFPPDQLQPQPTALIFPGLTVPAQLPAVEATVVPPAGWQADPLKASSRHNHQVWISPSGNTAYGIIRFSMPLPVSAEMALHHGFLPEMKKAEGVATLISSRRDPDLPGLRFIAEGKQYRLRTNLITRGWRGWAVYAGTLLDKEIVPEELALAELARDHTTVGLKR
jgi:hypothetical protein